MSFIDNYMAEYLEQPIVLVSTRSSSTTTINLTIILSAALTLRQTRARQPHTSGFMLFRLLASDNASSASVSSPSCAHTHIQTQKISFHHAPNQSGLISDGLEKARAGQISFCLFYPVTGNPQSQPSETRRGALAGTQVDRFGTFKLQIKTPKSVSSSRNQ